MKVIHLHECVAFGGIENSLLQLGRELRTIGIESEYYFRTVRSEKALARFRSEFSVYLPADVKLRWQLARGHYDLIRSTIWSWPYTEQAIRSVGFQGPVVLSVHQAFPTVEIRGQADHIVAVSNATQNALNNPTNIPVSVIHNGVDTRMFSPEGPQPTMPESLTDFGSRGPIALWVGRLDDWMKGFPLFIAVASRLSRVGWSALVVHSDAYPAAQELEGALDGRLRMISSAGRCEMPALYRFVKATRGCLLVSSSTEACPNCILEAQSIGLPVVSAAVGGIPELIEHGQTGFLFEKGASLSTVEQLLMQLSDREVWNSISQKGRTKVEKAFTYERYARQFAELFERLLSETHGKRHLTARQRAVRLSLHPRSWLYKRSGGKRGGWI